MLLLSAKPSIKDSFLRSNMRCVPKRLRNRWMIAWNMMRSSTVGMWKCEKTNKDKKCLINNTGIWETDSGSEEKIYQWITILPSGHPWPTIALLCTGCWNTCKISMRDFYHWCVPTMYAWADAYECATTSNSQSGYTCARADPVRTTTTQLHLFQRLFQY